MKQRYIVLLLLLLLACMTACTPGHSGSNIITFVRDGHLWTVDPDGANAFEIVAQATPVVGYSWSSTHQILAFRVLDADFVKTSAAKQLSVQPITGQIKDVPGTINTIGVDGGTPIITAFSSPSIFYSNPIWNAKGTHVLYRQTPQTQLRSSDEALWWVAQNDQPGGIAAKVLPASYSIPSLSSTDMVAGNSDHGLFTTTLAGTNIRYLTHEPLSGHPLPATLERVLWQPAHRNASLLYAIPAPSQAKAASSLTVQLILHTLDGQVTTLATCTCTQFAWSPDGNHVLYSTGSTYTVVNLNDHSSFNIAGEDSSVPYWSPDSQLLLLDGPHTLALVQIASHQQKILLSDTGSPSAPVQAAGTPPAASALLQPVSNSLWGADSRHFLFLTRDRLFWQGHQLGSGKGLYTVSIDNAGQPQGAPTVVDTGNDTQAGWTYQDANTSFLY